MGTDNKRFTRLFKQKETTIKEVSDKIKRLGELTEHIVQLKDIATFKENKVNYLTDFGSCEGVGVFKNKHVAVQISEMSKETKLLCHEHIETEILVLYEGDLLITFPKYSTNVVIGEPLTIHPGTPHEASTNSGCKVVAITIPASTGYPQSNITTI